jgi:mevalonate kinase
MEFISTACSKLILAGEHLVVHGYDGVAIPIFDNPTRITASILPEKKIFYNTQILDGNLLEIFLQDLNFYSELLNLSQKQTSELSEFSFNVTLPSVGVGLGASASFAVAMLKLIASFSNQTLTTEKLLELSGLAEKKYHGTPSGIDHNTIVLEKPIFLNGKTKQFIPQDLQMPEFWTNIKLINTGKPDETTKEMVAYVTNKFQTLDQSKIKSLNNQIPDLIKALKTNDFDTFKHIINSFGVFLESIPITTPEVTSQNQKFRTKNAAAKVCGAGGLKNGSGIVLTTKV